MSTEYDLKEGQEEYVELIVKERTVEDLILYLGVVIQQLEEGYTSGYIGYSVMWYLIAHVEGQ